VKLRAGLPWLALHQASRMRGGRPRSRACWVVPPRRKLAIQSRRVDVIGE